MAIVRNVLAFAFASIAIIVLGIIVVIASGIYDVAATTPHTRLVYEALRAGLEHSVAHHAKDIRAPSFGAAAAQRGLVEYRDHCSGCHGAPGVAPAEFALGMAPSPINLVHAARTSTPEEIYWTIKHGIKMTGMPAWEYRLDDATLWDLTAFVSKVLPEMSPAEYRELAERQRHRNEPREPLPALSAISSRQAGRADTAVGSAPIDIGAADDPSVTTRAAEQVGGGRRAAEGDMIESGAFGGYAAMPPVLGDPHRGADMIPQYGCTTCHTIPGVVGRPVHVGPTLRGVALRDYIGGVLPNTPNNLVRWLLDPPAFDPNTAMPDLGLTPAEAADIAGYLYTLDGGPRDR